MRTADQYTALSCDAGSTECWAGRGESPEANHVSNLDRKQVAAGVLFRASGSRVLLVEPAYKPTWEIPGGAVEAGESPWVAAGRECAEELDLRGALGGLLLIDHVSGCACRPEGMRFVFDGGSITDEDVSMARVAAGEIRSVGLYTSEQVRDKVRPLLADRIDVALAAFEEGAVALCEQGKRVR